MSYCKKKGIEPTVCYCLACEYCLPPADRIGGRMCENEIMDTDIKLNELKIDDMIEKKKMFMVWTLEIGALPPVVAVVDNGRAICYHHEGDWEFDRPRECEHFFDTEKEANEYIQERINALTEDKKKVTDVLSEIYSYMRDRCENEDSPIKLDDFLPIEVRWHYEKIGESKNQKTIKALLKCVRTRCIEVSGCSVALDNIGHIEWGDRGCQKTTIYLLNGEHISVEDYDEVQLLRQIFDHEDK
jgi:hypothetical protein